MPRIHAVGNHNGQVELWFDWDGLFSGFVVGTGDTLQAAVDDASATLTHGLVQLTLLTPYDIKPAED